MQRVPTEPYIGKRGHARVAAVTSRDVVLRTFVRRYSYTDKNIFSQIRATREEEDLLLSM